MSNLGGPKSWATNIYACLRNLGTDKILPITNAGAPVNGTTGTGAGVCGKGTLCTDTTNGKLYINTGTIASPTWVSVGSQT